MAHDPQTLTIAPGAWCAEADRLIGQAAQHATPDDISQQVERGGARLFYVKQGAAIVAAFVLRVDQTAHGPEGVIVAAAGKAQGIDLTATCMPVIESLFVDCVSIRYHTASPALARKLASFGYVPREIVCMKENRKNELLAA
jgi:hypothetical protein